MPYCSLNEAWGKGPEGLDLDSYTQVSYSDSNVYKSCSQPFFNDNNVDSNVINKSSQQQPSKPIPNMSRTNERLPGHSGPINRYYPQESSSSLIYNDKNFNIEENQSSPMNFNMENSDVPISAYSKNYRRNKPSRVYNTPIHQIKMRSDFYNRTDDEDMNESIDRSMAKQKNTVKKTSGHSEYLSSDDKSLSRDTVSDSEDDDKPTPINDTFKTLSKKFKDNKNDIIKYLIIKNDKLMKMMKKQLNSKSSKNNKSNGLFTIWDLFIVIMLGVLMLIIMEYIYKIALAKNST